MSNEILLTPVGRLVQGDCFSPSTKDAEGKDREQPQWYIGVAIRKDDPGFIPLWNTIQAQACQAWGVVSPDRLPQPFAWKVTDGDALEHDYAKGCWLMRFSTGFAPSVRYNDENRSQITDPNLVKRGYYVQVAFNINSNGSNRRPGIFLNHRFIMLVGYGEEIISGPDAKTVFAQNPALPPGASATPITSQGPGYPAAPGGAPQGPGYPAAPGGAPQGPGYPAAPGGAPQGPGYPAAPGGAPQGPGYPAAPGGAPQGPGYPAAPGGAPQGPGYPAAPGGAPQGPGYPAAPGGAPQVPATRLRPVERPRVPATRLRPVERPRVPATRLRPVERPRVPATRLRPVERPRVPATRLRPVERPRVPATRLRPVERPRVPATRLRPVERPRVPATRLRPVERPRVPATRLRPVERPRVPATRLRPVERPRVPATRLRPVERPRVPATRLRPVERPRVPATRLRPVERPRVPGLSQPVTGIRTQPAKFRGHNMNDFGAFLYRLTHPTSSLLFARSPIPASVSLALVTKAKEKRERKNLLRRMQAGINPDMQYRGWGKIFPGRKIVHKNGRKRAVVLAVAPDIILTSAGNLSPRTIQRYYN